MALPISHKQYSGTRLAFSGSRMNRVSDWVDRRAAVLYPAPTLLALFLLYVAPIAYTLYLAFHTWNLSATRPPVFVGWENFADLLSNERFRDALFQTFYFGTLAVSIQTILGIGMAIVFNREFVGRGLARTLFLFPMMATPIAAMIGWKLILDPSTGVVNLFSQFGVPRFALLADRQTVIPALALVDTWQWTPFVTLIILAGLSALPTEPFEAALMDGASGWQMFKYITLPLLRPVIIVAVLFRTIDSLKTFESVFVLTRGEPGGSSEILNLYTYLESFEYYHMGYASALMIVYFILILVFALMLIRLRRSAW